MNINIENNCKRAKAFKTLIKDHSLKITSDQSLFTLYHHNGFSKSTIDYICSTEDLCHVNDLSNLTLEPATINSSSHVPLICTLFLDINKSRTYLKKSKINVRKKTNWDKCDPDKYSNELDHFYSFFTFQNDKLSNDTTLSIPKMPGKLT